MSARPATWGYRTGKFVRRHARGVAAAAATLALVVALVGWYTVRLAGERDRARAQFERAELARDFLAGVIGQSNPVRQVGSAGQPTMRELVLAARDRLQSELVGQPELQAEMGIAVAKALHGLGEIAAALELLQASTEQLRRLQATNTVSFGEGLSKLGTMRSDMGDLTGGEAAFRESIAVLESLPASAKVDRQLILARTGLANLLQRAGRASDAVVMREAILEAHRQLLGDDEHPDLAWDWHNLAIDYQSVGRFADAEAPLRTAERLLVAAYGESDPRLVTVWLQLTSFLALRGKFDAAAEYDRKSEGLIADRYPDIHPLRASLHRIRARRRLFLGDAGAIASARKAVEIYRRSQHFAVGSALSVLGTTLLLDGHFREAADVFAEAHAVQRKLKGAEAADTRLQRVGRAVARWRLSGDADQLQDAV
ncbi:MAG: tetratricopeptide repeat protein, partial [Gemmatimonadales bacterium]